MQNELYVNEFTTNGSIDTFLRWIRYLKSLEYYNIIILLCELSFSLFSYSPEFLDELGMCYYYTGYYKRSWEMYSIIMSMPLTEERQKYYFFNAHFNIPHIMNETVKLDQRVINQISFNPQAIPLITFTITTCKRYDLFERTMTSFLYYCEDISLITHWLCVDDNSSEEDRIKMKKNFPFFEFVWKTPLDKGHSKSMNIILSNVQTPYIFHMEDDWQFFTHDTYIQKCLEIVNSSPEIGQCLVNKNYAETSDDIRIIGGIFNTTSTGLRYYVHEHEPNSDIFSEKYGTGANCSYWAHYSLRPGLNKVSTLRKVGVYDSTANHFEMDFAYRYMNMGFKTAFLDTINCIHIGRLTSERGDENKINAYILNDEQQFEKKEKVSLEEKKVIPCTCVVINLESRTDRLEKFNKEVSERQDEDGEFFNVLRYVAINGYELTATRQLEQIFNDNDYNYRKGMIGCALSHINLWISLLTTPGILIVLEDDVTFVPYFCLKVKNIFEQLDNIKWDIVFLGHHLYNTDDTDAYNIFMMPTLEKWNSQRSLLESRGGTGGYIINSVGALKMLHYIRDNGMTNGIDTMMQRACDTLNIYYCYPHLIYSECYNIENMTTADTDIQNNYDSLKRDLQTRIYDEIDYYTSKDINVIVCKDNKVDHCVHSTCICFNDCKDSRIASYKIEDAKVYTPRDVNIDVGLIYNGGLSIDNLI
jgi:GR25 family glycosyltransferase involved in LPS biosynthesis